MFVKYDWKIFKNVLEIQDNLKMYMTLPIMTWKLEGNFSKEPIVENRFLSARGYTELSSF